MYKSKHFELYRLAEGVYAAIGTPGGAAYSNAGIIDLGNRTLIFDTFETPIAGADLRSAAEQLTGRKVSDVIISHAHEDHWLGNQVFADVAIISTHQNQDAMLSNGKAMLELQTDTSELEADIREMEHQLELETNEAKRTALRASVARHRYTLEMLPGLELCYPNRTFEGKLIFYGSQRNAVLISSGKGHTPSDCYLVLPGDKIAFIGDLGFFECQPYMASCSPEAWMTQLEALAQSEIQTFVPGHGPVGSREHLTLQREYIHTLDAMVLQVVRQAGTMEDALRLSIPAPFDAWLVTGKPRFETNIRSAFERLLGK